MRAFKWLGIAAVAGLAAAAIAVVAVPDIRWRASLALDKAGGGYPEANWNEFLRMLAPGSGFWLKDLPQQGSIYAAADNPFAGTADLKRGKTLFIENCAGCHGADGAGGTGPSLHRRGSARTTSDWATYRTIQNGVPGSGMPAANLEWRDAWRVTGFVRSLVVANVAKASSVPGVLSELAPVTFERLLGAHDSPEDWLTYAGSYDSNRYSRLEQITRETVPSLVIKWAYQPPSDYWRIETTPLVTDGVMYVSFPPSDVAALDAQTGRELWHHPGRLPADLPAEGWKVNRGVALLDGMVFMATLDAHVKALNARTGELLWEIVLADYRLGYSFTSAPLAVKDLVIVGSSGGDFATQGFIVALDAETGEERWRFRTIPAPGEPGNDTWEGDSWMRGGAAAWMTGSYDARLNRIYWGIGNPAPDHNGSMREGDNLYSNSPVALDADTGELVWYFQFTPHDLHDWDSTQVPILTDDAILFANRNAFLYRLKRATGQFLAATPFVHQTWAQSIRADGRPVRLAAAEPSVHGSVVYPSLEGATNWWPPAYDPSSDLLFLPFMDRRGVYYKGTVAEPEPGRGYLLGSSHGLVGETFYTGIKAIRPADGATVWMHRNAPRTATPETSGLLATAGGIVFGADLNSVFALHSGTGERLWEFGAGGPVAAAPMTYAVSGVQFVVVPAGRSLLAFGMPE